MMPQFFGLLGGKIFLLIRMEVLLHLFYEMLGLVVIPHIKVDLDIPDLVRMSATRAEFPLLEAVNIGKFFAHGTTDDNVHRYEVMRVRILKTYLKIPVTSAGIL